MQFDQDTIKELAVHAVQRFVSDKTPLDVSIAERAKAFHLNEEQVRRVVEATNTIAFLKLRESADDKTFEFQVASFQGVMDALTGAAPSSDFVVPDDDLEKEASMEKVASYEPTELSDGEKHRLLGRHLHHVRAELEKVALDLYSCTFDLEKKVPALTKQAHWQERLSVVASESDFSKIMGAFGSNGFEKKASYEDLVFVGKELELATDVVALIKQAGELSSRKAELETMEKKAFAALASLVGRGLSGLRGLVKAGPLGAAAKTTSGAMGAAATMATAPIGAAMGAGIKGGAWAARNIKKTSMGTAGAIGLAASAATYQPKINQRTGRPNDVWANIYD